MRETKQDLLSKLNEGFQEMTRHQSMPLLLKSGTASMNQSQPFATFEHRVEIPQNQVEIPQHPPPDEPMIHSVWHVIHMWPGHVMYVLGAYYDDRRQMDQSGNSISTTNAFVRVLAQSSVQTHEKLINNPVYCFFSRLLFGRS